MLFSRHATGLSTSHILFYIYLVVCFISISFLPFKIASVLSTDLRHPLFKIFLKIFLYLAQMRLQPECSESNYLCFWIGEATALREGVQQRMGLKCFRPWWWKTFSLFLIRTGALKHKWHRTSSQKTVNQW